LNGNEKVIQGLLNELLVYFMGSFGDYWRIDYGSGHELCFMSLLLCLNELKIINKKDYFCIVSRVFKQYIELMQKIQQKYLLEPAGSKGVWGLDDYQFLTFYFGSSQLIENKLNIEPKDILNKSYLNKYSNNYMYLSSINYILNVKTGNFAEHSPLLNDISAVKYWYKVNTGLYKMYQDHVLKKFPVIQHYYFGSILSISLKPINNDNNSNKLSQKDEILQRKLALINKLNKKNKSKHPNNTNNPNNNNINHNISSRNQVNLSGTTQAPWKNNTKMGGGGTNMIMTKAPWLINTKGKK